MAATARFSLMITVHEAVPKQAPVQPENVLVASAATVSVTMVSAENWALHVLPPSPQRIAPVVSRTELVPPPTRLTVRVKKVAASAPSAVALSGKKLSKARSGAPVVRWH